MDKEYKDGDRRKLLAERRERIAMAVLAGIYSKVDEADIGRHFDEVIAAAVRAADGLMAALDD